MPRRGRNKLKNHFTSAKSNADRQWQDETSLRKRAAEDAVGDADSYAIRVRREFEKAMTANGQEPSALAFSREDAKAKVGVEEEVDGVLIHSLDGKTKLILSDEILHVSKLSEVESIGVDPIRLFHVQSRFPWMQQVRPGAA